MVRGFESGWCASRSSDGGLLAFNIHENGSFGSHADRFFPRGMGFWLPVKMPTVRGDCCRQYTHHGYPCDFHPKWRAKTVQGRFSSISKERGVE